MLGSVSQHHKILLYLIIKYAAKLAEMLKSEPSWGWLFFFFSLVLFFFYCSVVLVLSAPEAVEQQRFLTALHGLLLCLLLMSKQNAGGTLLENSPRENRHVWRQENLKNETKAKKKCPSNKIFLQLEGNVLAGFIHTERTESNFILPFFPSLCLGYLQSTQFMSGDKDFCEINEVHFYFTI